MSKVVTARIRQMQRIRERERIDPTVADILRKTSPPNIDQILAVMLNVLRSHAIALTDYIDIIISKMKEKAGEQGLGLWVESACCHREDCFTCMGKYDAHYPEVYVREYGGRKKKIRTRELTKFMEGLGFSEEEISAFCTAIDARTGLIKLTNCLALFYTKLGVVEIHHE